MARWSAGLGIVALAALAGCEDDGIRAYSVPKETTPALAHGPGDGHDHGPGDGHDHGPPTPAARLEWTLPEGWQVDPTPRQMRFATLRSPGGLEVAVSRFPGDVGGLHANVNRWREQLGLAPLAADALASALTDVPVGDHVARVLDVKDATGQSRLLVATIMTGAETWFVKAVAADALVSAEAGAFTSLVASLRLVAAAPTAPAHPTAPAGPAAPATTAAAPEWTIPEGWTAAPAQSAPRLGTFELVSGDARAEVVVTRWPGSVGGLLENVNRWRQQVGLAAVADLAQQPTTAVDLSGAQGTLVELDAGAQRLLVLLVAQGGRTWVFKLLGDAGLVAAQRETFLSFVRSTRLEDHRG